MMKSDNINPSIECSVCQCANHAEKANYCSLDCVQIGTHENDPTKQQCTDCKSFVCKQ